jgi:hypothetical protein
MPHRKAQAVSSSTNSTAPVRRVLSPEDLHRIHAAIRDAADTRQLLGTTLNALYTALSTDTDPAAGPIIPGRYAIPTSQWQAILAAITRRAEAWGTAAEVGLELATNLMPAHYDDPAVPAPDLPLPDYRPLEHRLTLSRDAVDVITACEAHLSRLRACYGPASEVYQSALHSWHRNLAALLTMNTGADTRVGTGLLYALIFHGATRRCTTAGCDALIDDDGTARPARTGAPVLDHEHTPSYPAGAARPGVWFVHS